MIFDVLQNIDVLLSLGTSIYAVILLRKKAKDKKTD